MKLFFKIFVVLAGLCFFISLIFRLLHWPYGMDLYGISIVMLAISFTLNLFSLDGGINLQEKSGVYRAIGALMLMMGLFFRLIEWPLDEFCLIVGVLVFSISYFFKDKPNPSDESLNEKIDQIGK